MEAIGRKEMKENKTRIRRFLRTVIWDESKLCALLAHAESKLEYSSCCCLIGVATADHALKGGIDIEPRVYVVANDRRREVQVDNTTSHYFKAQHLPFATEAERAYRDLGCDAFPCIEDTKGEQDEYRRKILRPMIRAELKRRATLKPVEETVGELVAVK